MQKRKRRHCFQPNEELPIHLSSQGSSCLYTPGLALIAAYSADLTDAAPLTFAALILFLGCSRTALDTAAAAAAATAAAAAAATAAAATESVAADTPVKQALLLLVVLAPAADLKQTQEETTTCGELRVPERRLIPTPLTNLTRPVPQDRDFFVFMSNDKKAWGLGFRGGHPVRRTKMVQKKRELEGDSSEEDSMPLGAKRFKRVKSEDAAAKAAVAPVAAAAAAAASKESDAVVKEEERNGGTGGASEAAATAPAAAAAAAAAAKDLGEAGASSEPAAAAAAGAAGESKATTSAGAAVSGSLAAALRNVKSEGPPKKPAALAPRVSSQSPAVARRRTNKFIKTEENFEPICRWWERDLSQIENNVVQGLCRCGILESDYATKIRFVRNFWRAFLSKLPADHLIKADPKHAHVRIVETEAAAAAAAAAAAGEDPVAAAAKARAAAATAPDACGFEACDFSRIKQHLDALKEAKKNLSKEEKEAQKDAEAAPFAYALVDWLREKVGNSKVEPPGLFRGRGEHPKQGMLKRRIFPEDVILNLAEDAPVPRAADMPGHCWRDIAHDCRVTWLAFYRDSINDQGGRRERHRHLKISWVFAKARSRMKTSLIASTPTLRLFKEELQQQQQGSTRVKTKKVVKAQPDLVGAAAAAAASGAAAAATEEGRGAAEAAGSVKHERLNEKGETKEAEEAPILDINLSDVNQLVQFYNDANRAVAILCNHQRSVPKQHAASMARLELQLQGIDEDVKELKAFQAYLKKHKGDPKGFKYHSDFIVNHKP
ncbi:hypothetical protein Emag_002536 [Eimeria magna]